MCDTEAEALRYRGCTMAGRRLDQIQDPAERREAARAMAASREVVTQRCRICGKEFQGIKRRKYCSPECRIRSSNQLRRSKSISLIPKLSAAFPSLIERGFLDDHSTEYNQRFISSLNGAIDSYELSIQDKLLAYRMIIGLARSVCELLHR